MAAEFDTSKCLFDPGKFGGGKRIQDIYPETSAYEEFNIDDQSLIKVAILLSDFNSPFHKIKDFKQLVVSVFNFLGINDDSHKEILESIQSIRENDVFEICSVVMQLQNNHEFAYWWNLNQMYYSLMYDMGRPRKKGEASLNDVSKKLAIQKQADQILQDLKEKEADLFGTPEMKMAIAKSKLNKIRTYAEMYAEENSVE